MDIKCTTGPLLKALIICSEPELVAPSKVFSTTGFHAKHTSGSLPATTKSQYKICIQCWSLQYRYWYYTGSISQHKASVPTAKLEYGDLSFEWYWKKSLYRISTSPEPEEKLIYQYMTCNIHARTHTTHTCSSKWNIHEMKEWTFIGQNTQTIRTI